MNEGKVCFGGGEKRNGRDIFWFGRGREQKIKKEAERNQRRRPIDISFTRGKVQGVFRLRTGP